MGKIQIIVFALIGTLPGFQYISNIPFFSFSSLNIDGSTCTQVLTAGHLAVNSNALERSSSNLSAEIQLIDGGYIAGLDICPVPARKVEIWLNLDGLTHFSGSSVGTNAFVLSFDLSRNDVVVQVQPGFTPNVGWQLEITDQEKISSTQTFTVAGWNFQVNPPNTLYHLANLLIFGSGGVLDLSLKQENSTIGSGIFDDNPPETILVAASVGLQVEISSEFFPFFNLSLPTWRTASEDYDYSIPDTVITVKDLVTIKNCNSN